MALRSSGPRCAEKRPRASGATAKRWCRERSESGPAEGSGATPNQEEPESGAHPGPRSDCEAGGECRERSEPACGARWRNSEPGGGAESGALRTAERQRSDRKVLVPRAQRVRPCGGQWSNSEPGGGGERSAPDCRASAERPQGVDAGSAASPACGARWSNSEPGGAGERSDPDCRAEAERPQADVRELRQNTEDAASAWG
jgi:hypothetical protein